MIPTQWDTCAVHFPGSAPPTRRKKELTLRSSEETVVPHQWESERLKFGTKQFYKVLISTLKDFMIFTDEGLLCLKC